MSKARSLAALGNAYDDGALSNRNLIINGAMQVWQRGTSFNGAGYTADRWFQASNNTNAITQSSVTLPNGDAANTLKVTATGSASEWFDIYQVVEDYKRLLGKTVTMSGWVRTNINGVVFRKYSDQNLSSVVPNDGAWHYIEATFTPDVSGGAVRGPTGSTFGVTFNAPLSVVSGDYYEFAQVQLEIGDTATPFEHRSYGQELQLCQRYYYNTLASTDYNSIGSGVIATSTRTALYVKHPVQMRVSPTVTILGNPFIRSGGADYAVSGVSGHYSNNSLLAYFDTSSGMTVGYGCTVFGTTTSGISCEAEL